MSTANTGWCQWWWKVWPLYLVFRYLSLNARQTNNQNQQGIQSKVLFKYIIQDTHTVYRCMTLFELKLSADIFWFRGTIFYFFLGHWLINIRQFFRIENCQYLNKIFYSVYIKLEIWYNIISYMYNVYVMYVCKF